MANQRKRKAVPGDEDYDSFDEEVEVDKFNPSQMAVQIRAREALSTQAQIGQQPGPSGTEGRFVRSGAVEPAAPPAEMTPRRRKELGRYEAQNNSLRTAEFSIMNLTYRSQCLQQQLGKKEETISELQIKLNKEREEKRRMADKHRKEMEALRNESSFQINRTMLESSVIHDTTSTVFNETGRGGGLPLRSRPILRPRASLTPQGFDCFNKPPQKRPLGGNTVFQHQSNNENETFVQIPSQFFPGPGTSSQQISDRGITLTRSASTDSSNSHRLVSNTIRPEMRTVDCQVDRTASEYPVERSPTVRRIEAALRFALYVKDEAVDIDKIEEMCRDSSCLPLTENCGIPRMRPI